MPKTYIIIFDGECPLCSASIKFLSKRDKVHRFDYLPSQSDKSKALIQKYNIEPFQDDTLVLIKEAQVYTRAEAVFEIIKELQGMWSLLRVFSLLPSSLTEFLYRSIAKNRYRVFGKNSACDIFKDGTKRDN